MKTVIIFGGFGFVGRHIIRRLAKFGYKIIGPEVGDMACGEFGEGKMSEPSKIIKEIENYFIGINNNKKFKYAQ